MSDQFLGDRKKALEEAFFAKQNAALLERIRAQHKKESAAEQLARICDLRDPELIEKLVELGVDAESWTALSLVPLVEVAWADGRLEAGERKAILDAAAAEGIAPGSPGAALLDSWLVERPQSALFASWGAYATGLATRLDSAERAELRRDIIERARKVARAAGGMLGIAAISDDEKRVIAALEHPFA
jgi:hypothetical protein